MRLSSPFHPHVRRQRALIASGIVLLALGTIGSAFFRTQVLQSSEYALRADDNRLRVIPLPPARGTIFDRNGEIVAQTLPSYEAFLEPSPLDSVRIALERLAPVLDLDSTRIQTLLRGAERQPSERVRIAKALSIRQIAQVEELRMEISNLSLEAHPVRHYPEGEAIAHLIGNVAEISRKELEDPRWTGYEMGQLIGKTGLERQYERNLGGKPGEAYVEVDARGRVLRYLNGEAAVAAIPGEDLHLSLDVKLQRFAHRIFPKDKRGAIVAMVPSTGEVLALYSHPTYDPNQLVGGVKPELWRSLNSDPGRPLLNRAVDGTYPPGSTWKLATALIGLERGVITPETKMPISCTGGMSYAGRYSRCWKKEGHGVLDLAGAIAHSCNVYFYQLGIRLGLSVLAEEGARLGFARKTGVDLPSEKLGTFPTGIEWYKKRFGWAPTPSEVMSLSIGQGPNDQTPLRMAQFFAALAGNGSAPAPRLVAQSEKTELPPETELRVSEKTLKAARLGLARVVEKGGTAHMASLKNWKLYGKTGTSQNTADPKKPHAWFTGFAGAENGEPEVVVAVVVEFGESGSAAAAPLAAKVADFYLNQKHGLPTDSLQTLRERLTGGRP